MTSKWIALLLFAASAQATCPASKPWDTICVAYTAPTKNTDGSPIVLPITILVYRVTTKTPLAGVQIATYPDDPAATILIAKQPKGDQCFFLKSVVNGIQSDPSVVSCKTIRFPAPTDGAIER